MHVSKAGGEINDQCLKIKYFKKLEYNQYCGLKGYPCWQVKNHYMLFIDKKDSKGRFWRNSESLWIALWLLQKARYWRNKSGEHQSGKSSDSIFPSICFRIFCIDLWFCTMVLWVSSDSSVLCSKRNTWCHWRQCLLQAKPRWLSVDASLPRCISAKGELSSS